MTRGFGICLIIMIVCELISAASQMLLKKSAGISYGSWIREYMNPWVISGYLLLFAAMFLTIKAYAYADQYMHVPMLETFGYIFVLIMGRIFYKEKLTRPRILGMALILSGILVYYALG